MAPEVIKQEGHNFFADIWSLGWTVYEMLTSRPPWSEGNEFAAMNNIVTGTKPPKYPDDISDELSDFLDWCFRRNPSERLNAFELQQHPFLRGAKFNRMESNSMRIPNKQPPPSPKVPAINIREPDSPSVKLSNFSNSQK